MLPFVGILLGVAPSRLTLNLDLPASQRWVDISKKYNATMWAALAELEAVRPVYKTLMGVATALFRDESNARWLPPGEWEVPASIRNHV